MSGTSTSVDKFGYDKARVDKLGYDKARVDKLGVDRARVDKLCVDRASMERIRAREAAKKKVHAMMRAATPRDSLPKAGSGLKGKLLRGSAKVSAQPVSYFRSGLSLRLSSKSSGSAVKPRDVSRLQAAPMISAGFHDSYQDLVRRIRGYEDKMQGVHEHYERYRDEMISNIVEESALVKDVMVELLDDMQESFPQNAVVFVILRDIKEYLEEYRIDDVVKEKAMNGDVSREEEYYDEEPVQRDDSSRFSEVPGDEYGARQGSYEFPDEEGENRPDSYAPGDEDRPEEYHSDNENNLFDL